MSLLDPVEEFLVHVAAKKAIARIIQLLAAWAAAHGAAACGVTIDPDKMTLAVMGGLEFVLHYARTKLGWDFLP